MIFIWKCTRCSHTNNDTRRCFVMCERCGKTYDVIPTTHGHPPIDTKEPPKP